MSDVAPRPVAIAGASGFVGGFIREGLPAGSRVTILGRDPDHSDIPWDLGRPDPALGAKLAARGVTDLVHAAWDMTTSSRGAADRVCVQGAFALLQAAREAAVSRVIFMSTISAFARAQSVYGQTKYRVERAVLEGGGVVMRLGLATAVPPGGMLSAIHANVRASRIIPLIGSGRRVQYLLPAPRLRAAMSRALAGDLDRVGAAITLGGPEPIVFRDLVTAIATAARRAIVLVPVPWRLLHAGLRLDEALGVQPPVRSDSVISFVKANPSPDFSIAVRLGL